jgi:hypothetical protein
VTSLPYRRVHKPRDTRMLRHIHHHFNLHYPRAGHNVIENQPNGQPARGQANKNPPNIIYRAAQTNSVSAVSAIPKATTYHMPVRKRKSNRVSQFPAALPPPAVVHSGRGRCGTYVPGETSPPSHSHPHPRFALGAGGLAARH